MYKIHDYDTFHEFGVGDTRLMYYIQYFWSFHDTLNKNFLQMEYLRSKIQNQHHVLISLWNMRFCVVPYFNCLYHNVPHVITQLHFYLKQLCV